MSHKNYKKSNNTKHVSNTYSRKHMNNGLSHKSDAILSLYIKQANQLLNCNNSDFTVSDISLIGLDSKNVHYKTCIHYDKKRGFMILYGNDEFAITNFVTEYYCKEYRSFCAPMSVIKQDDNDFIELYEEVHNNQNVDMFMSKSEYLKSFKCLILSKGNDVEIFRIAA